MPKKKKPTKRTRNGATRSGAQSATSGAVLPPITNVPKADVGAVAQSFIDNGVQRLRVFPNGPTTFTVQPD